MATLTLARGRELDECESHMTNRHGMCAYESAARGLTSGSLLSAASLAPRSAEEWTENSDWVDSEDEIYDVGHGSRRLPLSLSLVVSLLLLSLSLPRTPHPLLTHHPREAGPCPGLFPSSPNF